MRGALLRVLRDIADGHLGLWGEDATADRVVIAPNGWVNDLASAGFIAHDRGADRWVVTSAGYDALSAARHPS